MKSRRMSIITHSLVVIFACISSVYIFNNAFTRNAIGDGTLILLVCGYLKYN